jgi:hypothetical protein
MTPNMRAAILAMDRLLPEPTPAQRRTLLARGHEGWGAYIAHEAHEHGLRVAQAFDLFEALGPEEAFDGFTSHLAGALP